MDALVKQMNALCDALPFQSSWYLKEWATGKTADRMGDVPVPSASTTASRAASSGRHKMLTSASANIAFRRAGSRRSS